MQSSEIRRFKPSFLKFKASTDDLDKSIKTRQTLAKSSKNSTPQHHQSQKMFLDGSKQVEAVNVYKGSIFDKIIQKDKQTVQLMPVS